MKRKNESYASPEAIVVDILVENVICVSGESTTTGTPSVSNYNVFSEQDA